MNSKYRVYIIESEAGWGSKVDGHRDFDSFEEANNYYTDYNKQNNQDKVPSIYLRAEKPKLVDLDRVK